MGDVLKLVHDIPSSGQQGAQRRKLMARENFYGGWRIVLGVMFLFVILVFATNAEPYLFRRPELVAV